MEAIERLQIWYKNQCDGDWEHDFGVKVETLDNPGWSVTIDLQLTPLQGIEFQTTKENSEFDWYQIKIENWKYTAYGDPSKLNFLIEYFLDEIVPNLGDSKFEYEVFVPIHGTTKDIWTKGYATHKNDSEFELIRIEKPNSETFLSTNFDSIETWIKDFEKFEVKNKIGDLIETELIETFQGTRLGIKKDNTK